MRPTLLAVPVAIALSLSACGSDGRVEQASQAGFVQGGGVVTIVEPGDREPAPAFSGPTLDGGSFDLADERGNVVVLNVWGSWCAPCRAEAPALASVAEQTADDGVVFIGVNTRDTETAALAFEDEFDVPYPSVVDTDGRRLLAFRGTLPPAAIPSTLVVDRDGGMAARVLGEISETSLLDLVTEVAGEPA